MPQSPPPQANPLQCLWDLPQHMLAPAPLAAAVEAGAPAGVENWHLQLAQKSETVITWDSDAVDAADSWNGSTQTTHLVQRRQIQQAHGAAVGKLALVAD